MEPQEVVKKLSVFGDIRIGFCENKKMFSARVAGEIIRGHYLTNWSGYGYTADLAICELYRLLLQMEGVRFVTNAYNINRREFIFNKENQEFLEIDIKG